MGGRGSKSKIQRRTPQMAPPPQQQGPISGQVPDDNNTPVAPDPISTLQGMDDAQLAQLFRQSQKSQLPNHLNDADDQTQKFIFTIGMNDKPMVLDQAAFQQFMADNHISKSEVMSRSFNSGQLSTTAGHKAPLTPQDIADMLKYGRLNYIGGKQGGQAYGAGTYFDMNGGSRTGYGSGATVNAVLNPATAKVITDSQLGKLAQAFDKSHPQFAKATGGYQSRFRNNNMSIYAVVLGYNVIAEGNGGPGNYHNVIDRKALVYRK